MEGAACCLRRKAVSPGPLSQRPFTAQPRTPGAMGFRLQQQRLQDSTGWPGAVPTAGRGVRQTWAGAQPTPRASPTEGQKATSLTFLPAPDGDGVLGVHAHRHQQLPGGAEVDVVHALRVEAPQHGHGVLGHGVPHVDGRCCP